ncbi:MAG: radical SAM protein [Candidatus Kuenenbacteria bacterium]
MIDSVILIRPKVHGKLEFPFSLLYVATSVKRAGYSVEIIDLHALPEDTNILLDKIKQKPNVLLGISALSGSYLWVKKIIQALKKEFPKLPIVVGGHIAISHELLLNNTEADYVCLGEGEETLPMLIDKINNKQSLEQVPGIAYRENESIAATRRQLVKDFLLPDFSLIDVKRYIIHPKKDRFFVRESRYLVRAKEDDKMATIMFSRGCLGGCNFCYRHLPGYRQGKIGWCWEYLMILYNQYGVRYFRIDDELFISDKAWFEEMYQKIKKSKINILFRISGLRVDAIDDGMLKKLKEIGCIAINYGIESGSQKILDNMNKNVTVKQNKEAIQKTLKQGMQVMAYIMFGYSGENKETLNETLDMLLATKINPEDVAIFFTLPLPGTRLYRQCVEDGSIKKEEKFLESLDNTIQSQHDRYTIQLGEVTNSELVGFEKKVYFLLNLKEIIPAKLFLFKIIKKITFCVPYSSKLNGIFTVAQKILRKIRQVA